MTQTNIIINTQVEGVHHWPACDIKEVEFLKHPHRHIFHICAKKEVSHDDRDIEIIELKRKINEFLYNNWFQPSENTHQFLSMSCEEIAKSIFNQFKLDYCSVLEDGENGAEIFKKTLKSI